MKKRPSIIRFKALLISLVILGSLILPGQALGATLLDHYSFDSNALDDVNGCDMTENSSGYTTGQFGQALTTADNLTNAEVNCSYLPVGSAPRSTNVWIKKSSSSGDGLFGWGQSGFANAWSLLSTPNYYFGGYSADVSGSYGFSSSIFHMYTITYDGSELKLYYDGAADNSGFLSLGTVGDHLYMGCRFGGTSCTNAVFDELSIYDGDLTPTEISDLYLYGPAGPPGPPGPPGPSDFAVATPSVWVSSALILSMVIICVYFLIFFFGLYAIAFAIIAVFKPIVKIIRRGRS